MSKGSYSIQEWCARHGFCRATFYVLKDRGEAPRHFKVGRVTRISAEADAEWVTAREAASQVAA